MSSSAHRLTFPLRLQSNLPTFFISVAYGIVLASLPMEPFMDRENYVNYIRDSWALLLQNWASGWLPLLMNEPLWLLLNALLSTLFSPEEGVRVIILCSAGVTAWRVVRRQANAPATIPLILLFPKLIFYYVVALRNGVALALFLSGWSSPNRFLRWFAILLAPFVHVSYFVVLTLLALAWVTRRMRLGADLRLLLFALFSLAFALGVSSIAAMLSVRHASQYEFTASSFSGLGLLFWATILCLMWLEGKQFLREHVFEMGSIVFYLVTVWFVEVAARAFESTSLLVLLAGMQLTGWRRSAFLLVLVAYIIAHVLFHLDKPWLGFGIGS